MKDKFDGFAVNLLPDEDGAYTAHFVELPEVSAFGDSPEAALKELASAWRTVKATYKSRKLPIPVAPLRKRYSGAFNVRVDKALHRALAIEASRLGVSLNAIVAKKLSQTTRSL
jgi:predicted HicB family RNase H-like nuclease